MPEFKVAGIGKQNIPVFQGHLRGNADDALGGGIRKIVYRYITDHISDIVSVCSEQVAGYQLDVFQLRPYLSEHIVLKITDRQRAQILCAFRSRRQVFLQVILPKFADIEAVAHRTVFRIPEQTVPVVEYESEYRRSPVRKYAVYSCDIRVRERKPYLDIKHIVEVVGEHRFLRSREHRAVKPAVLKRGLVIYTGADPVRRSVGHLRHKHITETENVSEKLIFAVMRYSFTYHARYGVLKVQLLQVDVLFAYRDIFRFSGASGAYVVEYGRRGCEYIPLTFRDLSDVCVVIGKRCERNLAAVASDIRNRGKPVLLSILGAAVFPHDTSEQLILLLVCVAAHGAEVSQSIMYFR